MKTDIYTTIVLTVIAVFLGVIAWQLAMGNPPQVGAENVPFAPLQFDTKLSDILIPSGGRTVGRIAVDLRNGNIYGFPTDPVGYPRASDKDTLPVSRPVLLGRFDLSRIRPGAEE